MVKHDYPVRAIVLKRKKALPEVNQLHPNGFFELNKLWQLLIRDINPLISARELTNMLGGDVAFTNDNGFQMEGDPRRNYILGEALDAVDDRGKPALPKLEMLLCGGAKFYGYPDKHADGNDIVWVETLDGNKNPPSANWLINNPYYWYRAVTISPKGYIRNMPQGGNDIPKRIPIVSKYDVYIDAKKVVEI